MIELAGVLPVSALNLGLSAAVPGLSLEIAKLTADITRLRLALEGQVRVAADFPPNPASIEAALTAHLNPAELAAVFAPPGLAAASIDVNTDLVAELAIVTGQIGAVFQITSALELGLATSDISGWSYAGPAAQFGTTLEADTLPGFGRTAATAPTQGVIIATESLGSWNAFSRGVRTGANGAPAPTTPRLNYLGELRGAQWNTGTADLFARLATLLLELQGKQAAIQASIKLSVGLQLPNPTVLVNAGLDVVANLGLDGLIDNLLHVDVGLAGSISGLQARIDALVALTGELNAQLSAGGLAFWKYSGPASSFGSEFRIAIQNGIPGGNGPSAAAYGLALAGSSNSMGTFGTVFKTA